MEKIEHEMNTGIIYIYIWDFTGWMPQILHDPTPWEV